MNGNSVCFDVCIVVLSVRLGSQQESRPHVDPGLFNVQCAKGWSDF